MPKAVTALLLCALALTAAACGEREDPTPTAGAAERLDLSLDYFPNADHAGLYAAIDGGAFAATFLLFALAVGLYGVFALLERRVVTWR